MREWPTIWCECLQSFDVKELHAAQNKFKKTSAVPTKLKWPDKLRTLELIGKHVSIQTFKKKAIGDVYLHVEKIKRIIIDPITEVEQVSS